MKTLERARGVLIVVVVEACAPSSPSSTVESSSSPPSSPSSSSSPSWGPRHVTALCLPDPDTAASPLRGRINPAGIDYGSIECPWFAWPCERGIDCDETGCACACDYASDCGRVALDQYHPHAFDSWSFACESSRCVVSRR